jgi:hypothetical protein
MELHPSQFGLSTLWRQQCYNSSISFTLESENAISFGQKDEPQYPISISVHSTFKSEDIDQTRNISPCAGMIIRLDTMTFKVSKGIYLHLPKQLFARTAIQNSSASHLVPQGYLLTSDMFEFPTLSSLIRKTTVCIMSCDGLFNSVVGDRVNQAVTWITTKWCEVVKSSKTLLFPIQTRKVEINWL